MSQTLIFFLFIIGMFLAARLTNALADEGAKSIYGICAGTVYALLFFCTPFDIPMPPAPEEKHACGLAVLPYIFLHLVVFTPGILIAQVLLNRLVLGFRFFSGNKPKDKLQ